MTSRAVVARAHAKINLSLEVRGARSDGYHELRTIFQSLDLHDTVTCVRVKGPFSLQCTSPDVPRDASNLIWRAASAISQIVRGGNEPDGVAVILDKRIPVGGGLGGGSSDAAATLAALARLWKADLDQAQLRALAAELGADVPYFLTGGTALGLDRGDEIYPLADLPGWPAVLLTPSFVVSTKEAYAWFDADGAPDKGAGAGVIRSVDGALTVTVSNDLEPAVRRRHAAIGEMRAALDECGAVASAMSGSGSTVFGLFRNQRDAASASRAAARSGWHACLTRTLRRDEYRRRSVPRSSAVRLPPPAAIG